MYRVLYYTKANDECPLKEFIDALGEKPRGKIARLISYLARLGPDLPRPYADTLRDKIRELRVPYGRLQIRILYFFKYDRIILTQGFLKKTGPVPDEEIERAVRRMNDWLARHGD